MKLKRIEYKLLILFLEVFIMKHKNMMNIANKRGFLWQSFQIYLGVAGFYDYGPLGAILKND